MCQVCPLSGGPPECVTECSDKNMIFPACTDCKDTFYKGGSTCTACSHPC